jgi:hypothetical protein
VSVFLPYIGLDDGLGAGLGVAELFGLVAPPGLAPRGFWGEPGATAPGTDGAVAMGAGLDWAKATVPVERVSRAAAAAIDCSLFMRLVFR